MKIQVGSTVTVLGGRNKGQTGTVIKSGVIDLLIDFSSDLLVNEGFGDFETDRDEYWVKKEFVVQ